MAIRIRPRLSTSPVRFGRGSLVTTLALAAVMLGPFLYNEIHYLRGTGIHACGWEGTAISARPTFLSVVDFFTSDSNSGSWTQNRRGRGHHIAKVRDAAGRVRKFAISRSDYRRLMIPGPIACRDEQIVLGGP